MKKITFFAIAALLSVVAFAQKQALRNPVPFKAQAQLGQMVSAKQLSKDKVGNAQMSTRSRARKLAAEAADFVGDYTWNYQTASKTSTDLDDIPVLLMSPSASPRPQKAASPSPVCSPTALRQQW